jgi:hypothetical protein
MRRSLPCLRVCKSMPGAMPCSRSRESLQVEPGASAVGARAH